MFFTGVFAGFAIASQDNSFKLNLLKRINMVQASTEEPTSVRDVDPKIEAMIDWVRLNGGLCHAETRIDKVTGVRGLYASRDFTDVTDAIVRVPNKLIICPHHVKHHLFNGNWGDHTGTALPKEYFTNREPGQVTYKDVFELSPETFDPEYEYEPNMSIPVKLDNSQAEYFQITFFLITERLKGQKSSWKPFLDYLPASNETFFTIKDGHPIHDRGGAPSMQEEI